MSESVGRTDGRSFLRSSKFQIRKKLRSFKQNPKNSDNILSEVVQNFDYIGDLKNLKFKELRSLLEFFYIFLSIVIDGHAL